MAGVPERRGGVTGLPVTPWRRAARGLCGLLFGLVLLLAAGLPAVAGQGGPIRLQIVGGLAGVTQFTRLEQPFWEKEIAERSGGRITATIKSFDAGGLRGQEMLQLVRLGVVPFGTVLLSIASGDDPELNAVDLPVLNPDMATLRRTLGLYRDHLATVLHARYGIELLAVYAYPAQVLYCDRPFTGLGDLAGRKVRTSSIAQFELMNGLGAVPVVVPFAEMPGALREGVVDCAITGTLSGYEIGLQDVTTHVHAMAISWGLSFFGANLDAWNALPADAREIIRTGVADLERRIWRQAEADTERGLACNTGKASCTGRPERPLTLVPTSAADQAQRTRLLREVVLPRWFERCGQACVTVWNAYFAPTLKIRAGAE